MKTKKILKKVLGALILINIVPTMVATSLHFDSNSSFTPWQGYSFTLGMIGIVVIILFLIWLAIYLIDPD